MNTKIIVFVIFILIYTHINS